MEKSLILGQGKGLYRMNLKHLVGPESNEVFKKQNDVCMPKRTGTNLAEVPKAKGGTI